MESQLFSKIPHYLALEWSLSATLQCCETRQNTWKERIGGKGNGESVCHAKQWLRHKYKYPFGCYSVLEILDGMHLSASL